ncbi:MAG: NAD(P)/FAD-dependent oxidoreductase, partial [Pseudolabrys sp.]|nr:NAD(P)/FAD-dependent oxidoreductase [Pseudolabrys sp.]
MAQNYDALIIGGGHNGLVCGAYLAKAGVKTLVLERRHVLGGAAVTEEVFPGFRMSVASYVMSLLSPRVINDLDLRRFGLTVLPANDLFSPLENGDYVILHDDVAKTQREFARFSRKDAEAYPLFNQHLQEAMQVIRALLYETPVDIAKRDWRSIKKLLGLLWRNRRYGDHTYRIVDLMTQSVYDYLGRWFESDTIKALFGYYASIGTFAGPKSPSTAYVLLHHVMGEHAGAGGWGFIRGGMGA